MQFYIHQITYYLIDFFEAFNLKSHLTPIIHGLHTGLKAEHQEQFLWSPRYS